MKYHQIQGYLHMCIYIYVCKHICGYMCTRDFVATLTSNNINRSEFFEFDQM